MKDKTVRFESDPSLDHIEIVIRAPKQDATVTELLEAIASSSRDTITVFDGYGNNLMLREEQIVLAATDGKLINVVTETGSYYMRQSMKNLESILDSQRFVRISRFEIVNLGKVRRYDFTLSGTLRLELAGGMETWASRRCIPLIRKRLMGKERDR